MEQEIYALLNAGQLLRTAMSEFTHAGPALDPDRASYTVALSTARDLIIFGPTSKPSTRSRRGGVHW